MPNHVYDTVCNALSNIISRRAAENIVADGLRRAGTTPERVTATEMQVLLRGPVFARLQQIIPIAQAKGEIRLILNKFETGFSQAQASSLSPEVLEGLEAIKTEFKAFRTSVNPRALRLADGIGSLAGVADPIQALNALWVELDLLQAEESGLPLKGASLQNTRLPFKPGASGVFLPEDDFAPEFELEIESGALETNFEMPVLEDQVVLEELEAEIPGLALPRLVEAPNTQVPVAPPVTLPATLPATLPVVPTVKPVPKPLRSRAQIRLAMTPEEQENLLSRFASQEGVIGVALCSRFGEVIMARLNEGSATHLSGVVAATVMVLERSKVARLFYAQFEETSAFIAPFGDGILTVLANSSVNVGRVLSEVNLLDQVLQAT